MIFVTKARCDLLCHYDVRPISTARPSPSSKLDADPARRREDAHSAHRFARVGRRRGVRPRASRLLGQLPERLARLGNRVGTDDHAKIYGALHARIPMVTSDEQRAIQDENAEAGERFWDMMRDVGASIIEGHKVFRAAIARLAIAETAPVVAEADERLRP
jgi:hypothetical protein